MEKPKKAKNETRRIKTLHALSILDTAEEERFNRITRMAKRLFDVPIALVSLVDENRQWFKSCIGLGATEETPRDISFCGHAILGDDVFVIPDTLNDERFSDNPLVVNDPKIRFYAGYPISADNGEKMGTLCIISQKPRIFTNDDISALKDLASLVEAELNSLKQATHDHLTGVLNRRGFTMVAQQSLKMCVREDRPSSLIFFDLDKFKLINDTFGHTEGDHALTTFVESMQKTCRDSDVVCRFSGDEFVCLLAGASKQSAEYFIARFREILTKYNESADAKYDIEFSYGVVEYNNNNLNTVEAMLTEADAVMYKSKKLKSNH